MTAGESRRGQSACNFHTACKVSNWFNGAALPAGGAARVALACSEAEQMACNRRMARSRGVKVSAPHVPTLADLSENDVGFVLVDGSGAASALTQMDTPPSDTISPERDDCTRTSLSNSSAAHAQISALQLT